MLSAQLANMVASHGLRTSVDRWVAYCIARAGRTRCVYPAAPAQPVVQAWPRGAPLAGWTELEEPRRQFYRRCAPSRPDLGRRGQELSRA